MVQGSLGGRIELLEVADRAEVEQPATARSLIREWAPSVDRPGQTWDMTMWAVTQNALAVAYHRKRKGLTSA